MGYWLAVIVLVVVLATMHWRGANRSGVHLRELARQVRRANEIAAHRAAAVAEARLCERKWDREETARHRVMLRELREVPPGGES